MFPVLRGIGSSPALRHALLRHRPGAAWPALFLASLALHPNRRLVPRPWVAPAFRILGVLLAAVSAWWFASLSSESVRRNAPNTHALALLVERQELESAQGSFP